MIMEYQKLINLLDNTPNQLSKFRTKNKYMEKKINQEECIITLVT